MAPESEPEPAWDLITWDDISDSDPVDHSDGGWDAPSDGWDDQWHDELDDEVNQARQRRRGRAKPEGRRVVAEGKSGRRLIEEPEEFAAAELEPDDNPGVAGATVVLSDWRQRAQLDLESAGDIGTLDRYSSYDTATHGPDPVPGWVVTQLSALDTPLGILKTGKEADVHLLDRSAPGGPSSLMAVKTYRSADHRMFHRDSGYTEGRRTRRSRETRAMAARTDFGKELLAGKWAFAEFEALSLLWAAGLPVPYPVQLIGSELMMEFIGTPAGVAAPRLANYVPTAGADGLTVFTALWHDLVNTLEMLAGMGLAHGDLSPYNVLVHEVCGVPRCVLIDLPQILDVIANPQGLMYLTRDATVIAEFFRRRGVPGATGEMLALRLATEAGLT